MSVGLRILAAFLSPLLLGFYSAFLGYFFRDPARPFGFEKEYLLGALIGFAITVGLVVWVSLAVDKISNTLRLKGAKGYFFKVASYAILGCIPVVYQWLTSVNPHARLFYPQATFFPMVALVYLHVLLFLGGGFHIFRFFSKYKKLVYSCVGYTHYFKAVGKLQGSGIKYRTKSSGGFSEFNMPELISYDIYVKPEDEGKALQAIHNGS